MPDIDLSTLRAVLSDVPLDGRSSLLPALHAAQDHYGYLPEPVAAEIGRLLGVPLAEINGVIDFYSMFYRQPVGKRMLRVCTDPACAMKGGEALLEKACQRYGISPGETSLDACITIERAPCLGLCDHAPAALLDDAARGEIQINQIEGELSRLGIEPTGKPGGDLSILTANCGKGQSTSLPEYLASGGYSGLRKALQRSPEQVIAEVKASGLQGRGGAAFPTGIKWEGAATAEGQPRYVICNADESEPGTFKDRILLEEDPQRVIEGMLIAGYAIGASKGYIYIRGEYPRAFQQVQAGTQAARQAGYLGENILSTGFTFDIELRLGAGAYICGEETALFESIEGKRGLPRIKPPFPTTHGLFGKPTVINNVETLCNLPYILENGAAAYRQLGTEKSPGPKLFCVSGDVARPGLYEAPFGITIRHLLYDLAGGMRQNGNLQAILFGGAAGAFATPDKLDVRMTFEDLRSAGLPLGSGVVMVFDESRDLRQVLAQLGRFFAHESCGKCYPCQLGTQRQYEILRRVAARQALPGDEQILSDVGWTMTDSSLCGLGQTAASAVLSAIKLWPRLFQSD